MFVCIYMYACMYVCMYVCVYVRMHVCKCACMNVCMYVRMYEFIYVCKYVFLVPEVRLLSTLIIVPRLGAFHQSHASNRVVHCGTLLELSVPNL